MPSPKIYDILEKKIYILFDYNIDNQIIDQSYSIDNSIIYLLTSWYITDKAIKIVNNNKDYNIVLLANSEKEKSYFEKNVSCDVLYFNHNALLDENIFKINNTTVEYDLVIDSCFSKYKNRDLACKVNNTIHIGYIKKNEKVIPSFGTIATTININNDNYNHLNRHQICNIYNKSYVGGIFSLCEGACFASTQYLLAGIPVVSTESNGGRDIWYNSGNSIICDNNEDDCYKSVQKAKNMVISGEFNRESIRNNTIELMNKFRNELKKNIIEKFKNLFNIQINMNDLNINLAIY
jgi:hypothetical protein